jgi:hypothetical protein
VQNTTEAARVKASELEEVAEFVAMVDLKNAATPSILPRKD